MQRLRLLAWPQRQRPRLHRPDGGGAVRHRQREVRVQAAGVGEAHLRTGDWAGLAALVCPQLGTETYTLSCGHTKLYLVYLHIAARGARLKAAAAAVVGGSRKAAHARAQDLRAAHGWGATWARARQGRTARMSSG